MLSIALQYAAAASPASALATEANFCDSFSIQTSDANGGPVNQNHYASKPEVYLQGGPDSGEDTLPAGTLVYYQVQEPNGDPLMPIRSVAIGADGTFRVQLAPFDTTSNPGGEYKVVASTDDELDDPGCTKSDNFKVDGPGSLKVTKTVEGGESNGSFPFSVDCGIAGDFNGTLVDGGSVTFVVDALAECTVTEGTLPAPPAGYDWGAPTYTGNPATVESGKTVTVGIVNHLKLIPAPSLSIVKSVSLDEEGPWVDELTVTTGTTVYYQVIVTNTGNVPLHGVELDDDIFDMSSVDCDDIGTLDVGEDFTCTYTDVAQTGTTVNTATADSDETEPEDDDATVIASPAPTLTITKSNNAPLDELDLPTADEGDTVTFTLAYTHTGDDVTLGVITDELPVGLTYVDGSATSNAEFTFDGYDALSRTLTWTAASVTESGSVTYRATVDEDAAELEQPLENVATIDSEETDPDSDDSDVFVAAPPQAETSVPTPPQTDTITSEASASGSSLLLILLALAGIALAVVFVTPTPATIRKRFNR